MTLPTGTLQRQLQQGLDQLRRATDDALAQLDAVAETAGTQITDSQDDRAALHALCNWLDARLKTLEDAAGITPPPNPTDPTT